MFFYLFTQHSRTEHIENTLNPQFSKAIEMEYRFEEQQLLMFAVYDVDNESPSLEDDDFLGQLEVSLGGVVSVGSITKNLQHKDSSRKGKGNLGTITVGGCVCICMHGVCVRYCVLHVPWHTCARQDSIFPSDES